MGNAVSKRGKLISDAHAPADGNGAGHLAFNAIYHGDACVLLDQIADESVSLSFWSPPYHVGKDYEKHQTYEQWCELLQCVISKHFRLLRPGAFLAINVADIMCFAD